MRVLIISSTSFSVVKFRKNLIMAFKKNGDDVYCVSGDSAYHEDIQKMGVTFLLAKVNNRGINPASNHLYSLKIKKICQNLKPDVVFSFMLKPNTYGIFGAKKSGVNNLFCMVEGLGDVFSKKGAIRVIIQRYILSLYKKACKMCKAVFFLNKEDSLFFSERHIIDHNKAIVSDGIGINLSEYKYKEIRNNNIFIMVSRLIKSKGILEYCRAARLVRNKNASARFLLVGGEGNVKVKDIEEFVSDGSIEYLGFRNDIQFLLEESTVFVLPTYYREGLPMSVMEAMAIGRPCILTNSPGCNKQIVEGKNGYFCKARDPEDLANKMLLFLDNPNIREMGIESRKICETRFDEKIINPFIIATINKLSSQ